MKISLELSEKIQKVIDEFVADSKPFWVISDENPEVKSNLREIAGELNILPIAFDWFASLGIHPAREIILFNFEKPYIIKTEDNQKIINMVLFKSAARYPELEE